MRTHVCARYTTARPWTSEPPVESAPCALSQRTANILKRNTYYRLISVYLPICMRTNNRVRKHASTAKDAVVCHRRLLQDILVIQILSLRASQEIECDRFLLDVTNGTNEEFGRTEEIAVGGKRPCHVGRTVRNVM